MMRNETTGAPVATLNSGCSFLHISRWQLHSANVVGIISSRKSNKKKSFSESNDGTERAIVPITAGVHSYLIEV